MKFEGEGATPGDQPGSEAGGGGGEVDVAISQFKTVQEQEATKSSVQKHRKKKITGVGRLAACQNPQLRCLSDSFPFPAPFSACSSCDPATPLRPTNHLPSTPSPPFAVDLSHPTLGVQQNILRLFSAPNMRSQLNINIIIHHPHHQKNDFESIRLRNPAKLLCPSPNTLFYP